ncbi:hypothetical protein JG537_09610 [Streptococcus sp. SL1232]|uniref:hypothetical protein n=1 Tax=Streptococcus vicugnae TaxID=2740579 RepID=UPI0018F2827F|nr:hypothetical protein [Streptococcus vicugnae]MBJ7541931.1 hypothetical protein [Streptococcus vicugnae]
MDNEKVLGKVNGDVVSMSISFESKVIYFAGDTDYSQKIIKVLSDKVEYIFPSPEAVKPNFFRGPFRMNLQMLNQLKLAV